MGEGPTDPKPKPEVLCNDNKLTYDFTICFGQDSTTFSPIWRVWCTVSSNWKSFSSSAENKVMADNGKHFHAYGLQTASLLCPLSLQRYGKTNQSFVMQSVGNQTTPCELGEPHAAKRRGFDGPARSSWGKEGCVGLWRRSHDNHITNGVWSTSSGRLRVTEDYVACRIPFLRYDGWMIKTEPKPLLPDLDNSLIFRHSWGWGTHISHFLT